MILSQVDLTRSILTLTENLIFEREDDLASIKLVDFGLSGKAKPLRDLTAHCGTLIFMAPEIALKQEYTKVRASQLNRSMILSLERRSMVDRHNFVYGSIWREAPTLH